MVLVDEKGIFYNTDELELLSDIGNTADVYKLGEDKIIKVCKESYSLTPDLIYINDLLKAENKNIVHNLATIKNSVTEKTVGYIAKRYREKGIPFILEDKDKLLETIASLDETITHLSKQKVDMYDCFLRCNFILDENLTIIDTWAFYLKDAEVKEILKQNRLYIAALITEALISDIMQEEYCSNVMEYFEHIRKSLDYTQELLPQYQKKLTDMNGSMINFFR